MGTTTGENTRLSGILLMEQYRRTGNANAARRTWVEAGYCLDAPELIAAGSHERDIFGDGEEDWLAMPTVVPREPSNVEVKAAGACASPATEGSEP
jgi:hypothetical protein